MKWSLFVKENSQTDKEKAIEIIKDFINAKNVLFYGGNLIEKLEDREDLFGTGLKPLFRYFIVDSNIRGQKMLI